MAIKHYTIQFVAIFIAAFSGWLLSLTGIPLGWMIGAMLAAILMPLFRLKTDSPKSVMPYTRAAVGTMLGTSVSEDFLSTVADAWPSISLMLLSLSISFLGGLYMLKRKFQLDGPTAVLCAIPGGMSEMVLLGENARADQLQIAVVHAIRIAVAVIALPLMISISQHVEVTSTPISIAIDLTLNDWGWLLACVLIGATLDQRLKLRFAVFLVPLLISGALHLNEITDFTVPSFLVAVVQIVIGIAVGANFKGVRAEVLGKVAAAAFTLVVFQIVVAILIGVTSAKLLGADVITQVLSYSPGGLAEMSIIAVALNLEAAIVGMHHLIRLSLSLLVAPILLQRFSCSRENSEDV